MQCYRLTFTEPLLCSKTGTDYADIESFVHSDTLKSALLVQAFQVGLSKEKATDFLDAFTISSAFPFYNNHLFFPKPCLKLPINQDERNDDNESKNNKKFKKIAFIEAESFFAILNSKQLNGRKDEFYDKSGKFLFHTQQNSKDIIIYKEEEVQHARINGVENSMPYFTSHLRFTEGAGLFFLVHWNSDDYKKIFESALALLGDTGLGAYKTVGHGKFSFKQDEKDFTGLTPTTANALCNLSLYIPSKEEAEELKKDDHKNILSYNLVKRGGYITYAEDSSKTSWRKKSIFSFAEGSIFPHESLKGECADLKPCPDLKTNDAVTHAIYRDGRALFIPVFINNNTHGNN
ncbi:MAG: type III-A CRISPR-associated RAMP protein Csm4 [Phycisphaerales bacterium]|nr:type III-A CRISPR-associated RAMP protein Csm4 [Phycisphaerales bacterium]